MSNEETSSSGEPQDMAFSVNAMRQQFERLNMVLERFGERMDRVEANLQGGQHNANELESGSKEIYESKIEVVEIGLEELGMEGDIGETTLGIEMKKMGT